MYLLSDLSSTSVIPVRPLSGSAKVFLLAFFSISVFSMPCLADDVVEKHKKIAVDGMVSEIPYHDILGLPSFGGVNIMPQSWMLPNVGNDNGTSHCHINTCISKFPPICQVM